MEKPVKKTLCKPQRDGEDLGVNVYENEVCGNANCPSGCVVNECVINSPRWCYT
jgi:hypothetical protein